MQKDIKKNLKKFDLDWTVGKLPLFYTHETKERTSNHLAIVRNDNGHELGICKKTYHPVQNADVLEALSEVAEGIGFKLDKGGYMDLGQKTYFFLTNPEKFKVGKDEIVRSIFAINSHDRSKSCAFGYSMEIGGSGLYQFNRFYDNSALKFRHTKSAGRKMIDVPKIFKEYFRTQEELGQTFAGFQGITISKAIQEKLQTSLIRKVFRIDDKKSYDDMSTNIQHKIDSLNASIKKEISAKGQNLWGLFNGFIYFTNNVLRHDKKVHNSKIQSIYMGRGYDINNTAYDYLKDYTLKEK